MAPPTYGDLGKSSRDIFSKGYHFGVVKLDVKTKTPAGVDFNFGGDHQIDSAKVAGSLETKYKCKDYGLTFTEKWNTDNQLNTTIDVQDQLVKGLKLTFDSSFSPATCVKKGKIKAEYKHDAMSVNADVDMCPSGPLVNAAAVIGHNGWLAGYQMAFDSSKSKLTKNNFGLGYATSDFVLHTNVNDGQIFGGSIYQKINKNLETGVNLGWTASNNATTFGIGLKYKLDGDTSVRAKVNNSSQVGLTYQQKLREGVTLTMSTLIEGKNFNQGNHKYGIGVELEA